MMIKYILILGIGHLLGDFYLKNENSVQCTEEKYKYVLVHSFMYYIALLVTVLPVLSMDMFLAVVYAGVAHFLVDTVEYVILMKNIKRKSILIFLTDQSVHIICICLLAYMMDVWNFSIGYIRIIHSIVGAFGVNAEKIARWAFAILFIHRPVNAFIQIFLEDYKPKGEPAIIKADNRAGRRIGTVERLIMLIFLSVNQYTAIGFVLTAKSIARYDKIAKDEKFAEYYLLGTLVSTLCVIICRMLIIR